MRRHAADRRRRTILIRLLAVAVLAGLGVGGWRASDRVESNILTIHGDAVRDPGAVLTATEQQVRTLVAQQHGAAASSTRCYFAASRRTAAHRYEITGQMLCGPALFVDGDPAKAYLEYTAAPGKPEGGTVTLTAAVQTPAPDQVSVAGLLLVRPDGRRAPSHSSLAPPAPPPAADDLLTTTATLGAGISPAPADSVMTGQDAGVQLTQFGFVSRYGTGAQARSAPPGRRLLAFSLATLPGEYATKPPTLSLDVDGAVRGPLVTTAGYIVTAIPRKATVVDLLLTDQGSVQRISLLTGAPAAQNPAVSSRLLRMDPLAVSRPVTVRVTSGGKSGVVAGTIQFRSVWLSYWGADGSHASTPQDALLHVTATVRLAGDRQPYGAEAALLTAAIPDAPPAKARNAAANPTSQVDNVIEVPADITAGTLTYSGQLAAKKGVIKVVTPVQVAFTIPD